MKILIREARWSSDEVALRAVRTAVFIHEQSVPESEEWDEADAESRHWIALDANQKPVGCARLQGNGKIGRMAVLKEYRQRGIGAKILGEILNAARERHLKVFLYAQTSAIPFYRKSGFEPQGDVFYEVEIPHREMVLSFDGK